MIRPISINPILNGFIVSVGCQQLAYTSIGELTADLSDYLREPEATEKRLLKEKGINAKHTLFLAAAQTGSDACAVGVRSADLIGRPHQGEEADSSANRQATPC